MAKSGLVRLLRVSALGVACALSAPAFADQADCAGDKAALAKLDTSIAELESTQLPGKLAADMSAIVDQLIEALTNTKKDLAGITDPVNSVTEAFEGAKEKLDDIAKTMDEHKIKRPKFVDTMKGKIDKLAGDVAKGIEKYKKTAPGQTAQGLDAAGKFIGDLVEKLESAKTALAGINALDDAKNGTGAQQIRAMKFGFDQLKGRLAVDEVPGLGALLDAYSEAMDGIANSVDSIERTTKERLRMADVALRDSGFENLDRLYPGMQSPRERNAIRLAALKEQKAALQQKLAANKCDEKIAPPGPCEDPSGHPQKTNRLIEAMTRGLRDSYGAAKRRYESAFLRLSTHGLTLPNPKQRSRDELALARHESTLIQLERAARANDRSVYGRRDPLAGAVEVAAALGVTLPQPSREWNATANAYLPLLKAALVQKKREAATAAQAALAANQKAWTDEHATLLDDTKAARRARDEAKAALDKSVGERLAMEAAAKQWTKAQADQFDECYPDKGRLRREAAAKMPPAAPTTPAAKPEDKKKVCKKGGGLAGAMDNVACQIGGGQ